MKYPNKLVSGNTIAIISPSNGLNKEKKITLLENAEKKLEKCGFNKEGHLKQHIFKNGYYYDAILYGLLGGQR